ncbi:Fis family transcriptional regulator [Sphingomonas sp. Leaf231]|uniref:sigma-54 interaction domain-containing protein n=1 Tax=Sphingomonas sp. Leaf231 TaxID=1736301 RepID=UPI0006F2C0F3|nr:sigma 54-interacting transcriptional regulator [Sphingomonas sp. Leaf231]KQN92364.1 Fis family transcriptional regulator [Sphingomonas sp. Leaf231]
MRSIMPTATVEQAHLTLVSSLRAQGFAVQAPAARPQPNVTYLVADGEPVPAPARTVILGNNGRQVIPHRDGQPARIAYGHEDAAIGNAFARALVGGPTLPTAADPESLALLALAERVAQADITVLINGPTGTGKEVLARTIHLNSERRDGPFIAINCAALPETMLEAMLFGHQKGAFTGASSGGEGFFRAADGGTLLLDEVAEMPLNLQAKLLRVLQEREVVPIGATMPQPVNVRVVACANRDLQAEVAAGRFRADLYYRLSVFPLATRSLADRPQDIPALAATMILRHAGNRAVVPWPSDEAIATLVAHDWPGNVRELENVIQRALLFAGGDTIEAGHIVFDRPAAPKPAPVTGGGDDATLGQVVQFSEFAAIRETLAACGGSRIETARRLGISERTLRYRLAKARENGDDLAAGTSRMLSA